MKLGAGDPGTPISFARNLTVLYCKVSSGLVDSPASVTPTTHTNGHLSRSALSLSLSLLHICTHQGAYTTTSSWVHRGNGIPQGGLRPKGRYMNANREQPAQRACLRLSYPSVGPWFSLSPWIESWPQPSWPQPWFSPCRGIESWPRTWARFLLMARRPMPHVND